jgi:hypothetical protein
MDWVFVSHIIPESIGVLNVIDAYCPNTKDPRLTSAINWAQLYPLIFLKGLAELKARSDKNSIVNRGSKYLVSVNPEEENYGVESN